MVAIECNVLAKRQDVLLQVFVQKLTQLRQFDTFVFVEEWSENATVSRYTLSVVRRRKGIRFVVKIGVTKMESELYT